MINNPGYIYPLISKHFQPDEIAELYWCQDYFFGDYVMPEILYQKAKEREPTRRNITINWPVELILSRQC